MVIDHLAGRGTVAVTDAALCAPFAPLVARIIAEAQVIDDRIIKIDHFLNHRIDAVLMQAIGAELARRVAPFMPDLVLTAEASGIPPALTTALALGIPLVYAKKYAPLIELPAYSRIVPSPTRGGEYRLAVARTVLPADARVVLIDDFLANGGTAAALADIIAEAGARLVAAGFVVEKTFQQGRERLAIHGPPPVAVLAQVARLAGGRVVMAATAQR
jgi:xanthine phosphoribosyltransferase